MKSNQQHVGRVKPADRLPAVARDNLLALTQFETAIYACRPSIGAALGDVMWRVGPALRRWSRYFQLILAVVGMLFAAFAFAQETSKPLKKIGVLWSGTREGTADYWGAFVKGMNELGWVDGKNAKFIMRFDNDDKTRLPKLAEELVTLGVDVIALTSVTAPAARKTTTTIPIVSVDSADPIEEGLTKSLSRPVGNLTGVSWQSSETAVKRVELAKELVPGLKRIALLTDMGDPACVAEVHSYRAGVAGSGIDLRIFDVRNSSDFPAAFTAIQAYRPEALIYPTTTLTVVNLQQTLRFVSSIRVPTFSEAVQYAEAGILLTYGPDYIDAYKRGAIQVHKILNGAKPADLPWEQPTKFELAVNMKTAKALGVKIPESIAVRATRVIR